MVQVESKRVNLNTQMYAIVLTGEIAGVIERNSDGNFEIQGKVVAMNKYYGTDLIPAHYAARVWNGKWYELMTPFDIRPNGKFVSVTIKDANNNLIEFDKLDDLLVAFRRCNSGYGYKEDDLIRIDAEEPYIIEDHNEIPE